jgi:bifunctional non-homologous end joining protein LigD
LLAERDPKRYTTEQRRQARKGRLFVDVMRNAYAQTAVVPYAVRARPEATVATPLDWSEVSDDRLRSDRFTVDTTLKRIHQGADPWKAAARRRSLNQPRQRLHELLGVDGE